MAVLAIHDLSCYAKSSLTVVLPVLEALSVETAVLPAALLSTQTDGFEGIYIKSGEKEAAEIIKHFKALSLSFDGIYSGYLGSNAMIDIVKDAISSFPGFTLVDPVLGDNGEIYQGIEDDLVSNMLSLVKKADVITPNLTEAMILTGIDEGFSPKSDETIKELIDVLRSYGPKKGVITGIPLLSGALGNAAWDGSEIRLFQYDDLGVSFPGSGDLFASILFGLLVKGGSFFGSALHATSVSTYAVAETKRAGRERRLGIMLSPAISELRRRML